MDDTRNLLLAKLPPFPTAVDLAPLFAVAPKTVLAWSHCGRFPASLAVGGKTKRWSRSVVVDFVTRQEASPAAAG